MKISQSNYRFGKRLIMAGSTYFFLSQFKCSKFINSTSINFKNEEFTENKEYEEQKRNEIFEKMDKSQSIHDLYGTLKCSLLLLKLHKFEPFDIGLITLIIQQIEYLFEHFYENRNQDMFEKHSAYTVRLINDEFNEWNKTYNTPFFFVHKKT